MTAVTAMGFASASLDRADHVRKDPIALAAARASDDAAFLPLHQLRPFVLNAARPTAAVVNSAARRALASADADAAADVFLGFDAGRALFAFSLPDPEPGPEFALHGLGRFEDFRRIAPTLDAADLERIGLARALLAWRDDHGFCARCGAASRPADGGWKRVCLACDKEHFPRVDPVAIMAIEHDGRTLLGRQPGWPAGFWSCLAGFIEPGETIEAGAAREAFEEAGVRLTNLRYRFSQPWPFPSSLMIGFAATALDDALTVDTHELEAALWTPRDEVAAMLAGRHPTMRAPPPTAIAHHLLQAWVDEAPR